MLPLSWKINWELFSRSEFYSPLVIVLGLGITLALTSWKLRLGLLKRISISSSRSLIQLLLMGSFLGVLIHANHFRWNILMAILMSLFAVSTVRSRLLVKDRWTSLSLFIALGTTTWPATYLLVELSQRGNLFDAINLLPLLGIVLGNTLNALTLSLLNVQKQFRQSSLEIETKLGLGANWREASLRVIKDSMEMAVTPILNNMAVVGIIGMPGLMVGQILAGANPLQSAHFQYLLIMILFAVIFLSSLMGVYLQCYFQFQERGRFFGPVLSH